MQYFSSQLLSHEPKHTSLPIIKHSKDAVEQSYLIVARLNDNLKFIENIKKTIQEGKIAGIIGTKEDIKNFQNDNIELIECSQPTLYWAFLCSKNYPASPEKKIAITGTSGKTSTTWFIYQILLALKQPVLLINSIGIFENENKLCDNLNSTPDSEIIHKACDSFVKKYGSNSFLICETTSIGIEQHRAAFLSFNIALFINFSHEHLDYHKTMDNYKTAKLKLGKIAQKFLVHNSIEQNQYNKYGHELLTSSNQHQIDIEIDNKQYTIKNPLIGTLNHPNILNTMIALNEFFEIEEIIKHLNNITSPEGRGQIIKHQNKTIVIDNAHKPDALETILKSLNTSIKNESKIIVVTGCGGNRDAEKRPIMGKIMQQYSNLAIITTDNPRNEDPLIIAQEMLAQIDHNQPEPKVILNRKEAIEYAIKQMQENDILLVAGKGNEEYQIIKDEKIPFNDYKIVEEILKKLAA